jgi:hypothetical protein
MLGKFVRKLPKIQRGAQFGHTVTPIDRCDTVLLNYYTNKIGTLLSHAIKFESSDVTGRRTVVSEVRKWYNCEADIPETEGVEF